jgi:ribosomal protein S18 acetylase RimI-like enzyme
MSDVTPTKITSLSEDDLPAAIMLWRTTPGIGLAPDETPEMLRRYLLRNPGISSAAHDADGRLAGAVLGGHDGRRGCLYHLAVAESHRNRGIGRALVERTLSELAAAGIAKASLFVYADNDTGNSFWRRIGWTEREDLGLFQRALTRNEAGGS